MNIIKFYNRERELQLLNRIKKPFFAVIYGRRRIGKTALILNFLKNKDFVYLFVNPKKTEKLLLEEFSSLIKQKLKLPDYVRPSNWEEFFELLKEYKGYVFFDEFQWFLNINKAVPYILQKYWDLNKKPSIIICGSIVGMMKKLFVEEGTPLYKRADITIKLKELSPEVVFKILEDLGIKDVEEKFKFYILFKGIPYYYHLIFKYNIKKFEEAIEKLILDENAPLRNEVEDILIESFGKEYRVYLAILYAIAEGKTKLSEIVSYAGIKETSLMPYLYDLIDLLGVLEKQRIGFKKKYVYLIKDNFHAFWLRFIYKYKDVLTKESLFEKIKRELNDFLGIAFENTVRELAKILFNNKYERYMKYFGNVREKNERKTFDIDILALNEKTRSLLACECKWQAKVNAKKVVEELAEKLSYVEWHADKRKESFAVFAKSFRKKIKEWQGKKVYCYDLKDLEKRIKKLKN